MTMNRLRWHILVERRNKRVGKRMLPERETEKKGNGDTFKKDEIGGSIVSLCVCIYIYIYTTRQL